MKYLKLTAGNIRYVIQELLKLDLTRDKRLGISDWDKARGLSSNALSWVWYKEIGDFIGMTTDEVHSNCKIQFGLPILFSRKDDYVYDVAELLESIQFWQMPLEMQWRKIKAIAITSKFKTKEMSRYLEDIQNFYGVQGLNLE